MLLCKTLPQLCASLFAYEDNSHRVLLVLGAAAIHAIYMQQSCESKYLEATYKVSNSVHNFAIKVE